MADSYPLVRASDASPTGWLVTFRYDAPELTRCGVIGDWLFSDAAHADAEHAENRMPHEWKQGDFAYKAMGLLGKQPRSLPRSGPVKLDAKSIGLDPKQFLCGMYEMEKGADGAFTLTIPLPSGTFLYQFVRAIPDDPFQAEMAVDPCNPPFCYVSSEQRHSTVTVPNSPVCEDRAIELPAGTQGRVEFFSYPGAEGKTQVATVYLPHGYDPAGTKHYPVLYLSHGGNGHHSDWVHQGKVHHLLDHLIEEGALAPTVVVMMDNEVFRWQMEEAVIPNLRAYLIPAIEGAYCVDPAQRAYAGLSMGGILGARLLLRHTEIFGWYGVFSGGNMDNLPYPTGIQWPKIFVGYGCYETGFDNAHERFVRELEQAGASVQSATFLGGHQWQVWRKCFEAYARTTLWKE